MLSGRKVFVLSLSMLLNEAYVYVLSIVVCPFLLFLLAIVLSVFLRHIRILIAPLVYSNSSYSQDNFPGKTSLRLNILCLFSGYLLRNMVTGACIYSVILINAMYQ